MSDPLFLTYFQTPKTVNISQCIFQNYPPLVIILDNFRDFSVELFFQMSLIFVHIFLGEKEFNGGENSYKANLCEVSEDR